MRTRRRFQPTFDGMPARIAPSGLAITMTVARTVMSFEQRSVVTTRGMQCDTDPTEPTDPPTDPIPPIVNPTSPSDPPIGD